MWKQVKKEKKLWQKNWEKTQTGREIWRQQENLKRTYSGWMKQSVKKSKFTAELKKDKQAYNRTTLNTQKKCNQKMEKMTRQAEKYQDTKKI